MRAIVVYESIFGNTRNIAEAIGEGLRSRFHVVVTEVGAGEPGLTGVDLLVVGGPIHAWTMSRAGTRKGAREQAMADDIEPVSAGIGIREYLAKLADTEGAVAAASFDTALREPKWLPKGSAAKPAAKRLAKHGYRLIAEPMHFYVEDAHGPLVEGELERARTWGTALADAYIRDQAPNQAQAQ